MYSSPFVLVLLIFTVTTTSEALPGQRDRRYVDYNAKAIEIMKQTPLIDGYVCIWFISVW